MLPDSVRLVMTVMGIAVITAGIVGLADRLDRRWFLAVATIVIVLGASVAAERVAKYQISLAMEKSK